MTPTQRRAAAATPTAALLLALCSGTAFAGRPLVSETADATAAGQCEIEGGLARASGKPAATATELLGACGIAGHTQLGISMGAVRQSGASDLSLGLVGKTMLNTPSDGATGYALAYALGSEKTAGQGWRHGSTRLFGVASKPLGQALGQALLGHLNLGWLRTEQSRLNSTTWSLGVEGDGQLRWAADVFGDDRHRPWVSTGLLFPLSDALSVNLAYAQQFAQPRVRQWTLGFKIEL